MSNTTLNADAGGPVTANPFTTDDTPRLSGLTGGDEAFGLTALGAESTADTLLNPPASAGFGSVLSAIQADGPGVGVALLDDTRFLSGNTADFDGFDLLLLLNLTDSALEETVFGLDGAESVLLQGGFVTQDVFGGAGATALDSFGLDGVYATLVAESLTLDIALALDDDLLVDAFGRVEVTLTEADFTAIAEVGSHLCQRSRPVLLPVITTATALYPKPTWTWYFSIGAIPHCPKVGSPRINSIRIR